MNDEWQNEVDPDEEIIYISKSELKRDAIMHLELGEKLINLSPANLEKIPMDAELSEAVHLAVKIRNKHGAFKRQVNYVGKLLRSRELEPINIAIAKVENQHLIANQYFHKLENLRDQVIEQGDDAINQLLAEYPDLERPKLRQLVRQAKKEASLNKPPKSARQIFQYLKENIPAED
ncbi:hypothetical protein DS2_07478 [Catenovulum agarivorans DS-2]|uniref:Dual-action ribosomal maturation protein DarP n=1 Tax=Catenovulum agarivorans DS-2 TaxID=1328313 RepID=W7QZ68_9ALTE|nr:ribosome biogenesis factor YjgA [Catenovulum agarivorans]EWH10655.1 hypothetical protein DS2_07478 [Catenovulum agarivorans DS-2]